MFGFLARFFLALLGWSVEGDDPGIKKAICVIAPHTSRWDWFFMLIAGFAFQRRFRYLVSYLEYDNLVKRLPLKLTGGIPVNRTSSTVQAAVDYLNNSEYMLLAIAPEGQLAKTDYWHSGFYHMAREADVPIIPVSLDFAKRKVCVGDVLPLSGDVEQDMQILSQFYQDVHGKFPDQFGPVRVEMI